MQSKQCAADPKAQGVRNGHLEHAVAILKNAAAEMRQAPKELQQQAKVRDTFTCHQRFVYLDGQFTCAAHRCTGVRVRTLALK